MYNFVEHLQKLIEHSWRHSQTKMVTSSVGVPLHDLSSMSSSSSSDDDSSSSSSLSSSSGDYFYHSDSDNEDGSKIIEENGVWTYYPNKHVA